MALGEIFMAVERSGLLALAVFLFFVWRDVAEVKANLRVLLLYCPMIRSVKCSEKIFIDKSGGGSIVKSGGSPDV